MLPSEGGASSTNKLRKGMSFTGLTVKLFEGERCLDDECYEDPSNRRNAAPAPKRWVALLDYALGHIDTTGRHLSFVSQMLKGQVCSR